MVTGCKRIVFPSQAISERQLRSDLPTVPGIQSPRREPQRVWIDVLCDLAIPLRKAEQKLGKTVVGIGRRVLWRAIQRCHASVKSKGAAWQDRKSTRLNSSHSSISYAVFCLKK